MGLFDGLNISKTTAATIEWDMTPDLAFCTFSAKGLREELRKGDERVCYFFIDNWGNRPRLYLMERGTRYVHILAEITAPVDLLVNCIVHQGATPSARDNFPIDPTIKAWLRTNVIEPEQSPFVVPVDPEQPKDESPGAALPACGETGFSGELVDFSTESDNFDDDQIHRLICNWNFFDAVINPQGKFDNFLADGGDGRTVIDERTGLVWQRGGLDLSSKRTMKKNIAQLNCAGFAGSHDWRLPTLAEAMSLMESCPNEKGLYLHPCFSTEQPFIFVDARRKPTGYWFLDFRHGKIYWSSGSVPGGFARLCRHLT